MNNCYASTDLPKSTRFHLMFAIASRFIVIILAITLTACSDTAPGLPRLSDSAVVLAFGDSLTYGTGTARDQSYPAVLSRLLQRKVINAGIPGEISADGRERLPGLLDQYQPELLILCHGGNDMLRKVDRGTQRANLHEMISLARMRNISVVLIAVPEPGLLLESADIYPQLASEFNIPVTGEILSEILSSRSLKSDAIHPNAEGYRKLAASLYELLHKNGAIE